MPTLIIGLLIFSYVIWIIAKKIKSIKKGDICDCSKCNKCNK